MPKSIRILILSAVSILTFSLAASATIIYQYNGMNTGLPQKQRTHDPRNFDVADSAVPPKPLGESYIARRDFSRSPALMRMLKSICIKKLRDALAADAVPLRNRTHRLAAGVLAVHQQHNFSIAFEHSLR